MAIAESILFQINSSNYTAPIFTIYKPQAEHSGFATTLRLTINIKSIDAAEFPYIPDDTPPDVLQQILEEVALNTPFKEIILYVKKGTGAWIERAPIRIFNKEPYYDVNLMRFFSDSNTIDIAEDLSLGIQIKTGNVLTSADTILVWGTVVAEKKNNGNEELGDRISALEILLSTFGAPSANLPGSNGLVPAPPAGGGEFLLRGDRGWQNPSQFATQANIDQAILDWVGTAPEHLNTLIEFGNAINNDANFFATITAQLALKAPLANPAFTGFVALGGNIATKKILLSGTTSAQQGGIVNIPHGLGVAGVTKIRNLTGIIYYATNGALPFGSRQTGCGSFWATDLTNFSLTNEANNSSAILSKPFFALIEYVA